MCSLILSSLIRPRATDGVRGRSTLNQPSSQALLGSLQLYKPQRTGKGEAFCYRLVSRPWRGCWDEFGVQGLFKVAGHFVVHSSVKLAHLKYIQSFCASISSPPCWHVPVRGRHVCDLKIKENSLQPKAWVMFSSWELQMPDRVSL